MSKEKEKLTKNAVFNVWVRTLRVLNLILGSGYVYKP